MNIRKYIISKLLKDDEQIHDKNKLVEMSLEIVQLKKELNTRPKAEKPLTKGELTMMQLGSYLPSFKTLAGQSDDFKRNIGRMCYELTQGEGWRYLIEHLKQDQVNLYFFNDENSKSEEFVRGSINGIYIVDEQINNLADSYAQNIGTLSNTLN